ncbi:hypothetical protein EU803_15205 [Loktanella sp. IMCC34160]|uniref:alpha/beta hydrolase n=1 Tax=Loktanella sp. IMCC34160 TaxID=2510646 RepID=UPI00101D738B|nr:alpha/beta hydrolase [Loktanella sp. IMCC34160]RYG89964.1 hypothetical protein EU803_15205 [Loktanella sp. IMCC34160]
MWSSSEMSRLCADLGDSDCPSQLELVDWETGETATTKSWVKRCKTATKTQHLRLVNSDNLIQLLLFPRQVAERYGSPVRAVAALMFIDPTKSDALNSFSTIYSLSPRETDLLRHMLQRRDVRQAAVEIGVTYETGRTYLKRIYEKTGCANQAEFNSRILSTPFALLRDRREAGSHRDVRRMFILSDRRKMEAIVLGPKSGSPVVFFQGNVEASLNVVDDTKDIEAVPDRMHIHLIIPQWAGTDRSEAVPDSYRCPDFVRDVVEIANQLSVCRFATVAKGFATDSALRFAYDFPDRVTKVVLASAYNSNTAHAYYCEETSTFDRLSNHLVRKPPRVGRAANGLMWRQVAQDPAKIASVLARSATCEADRKLLEDPRLFEAERSLITRRFAQGYEGQVHQALDRIQPVTVPLEHIQQDVEIYQCDKERVTPLSGARLLADALPHGRLHVLHGAGHHHIHQNWPCYLPGRPGAPSLHRRPSPQPGTRSDCITSVSL